MCVLPEVEIFLGDVPIAKYEIPGSQTFADTILPFVQKSNVIILANHGTVSYGQTVEKAYWWTEILDAYCRMLMLARGLGSVNYFSEPEAKALLDLKSQWGYADPRVEMKNCDICANDTFRKSWQEAGVAQRAFDPPRFGDSSASQGGGSASGMLDQEALIQAITDRVMATLNKK
jgi:L-fuculose-phosphate aldolase